MFKIVLPEILQVGERLRESNRLNNSFTQCYCKIKQQQRKFKINGVVRLVQAERRTTIEGNGQITIVNDGNEIIYFGSWFDSELTVYNVIGNMVNIFNNNLFFNNTIYPITSIDQVISHYPIAINHYQLNIPMVLGADLNLELADGTTFIVDINNAKPLEQFNIGTILINKLNLDNIYTIDNILFKLDITIYKNQISYKQTNLTNNVINTDNYKLIITPSQFLTLFLQLPSTPINLDIISKKLQQLRVIM